jgi:hypothetical protein
MLTINAFYQKLPTMDTYQVTALWIPNCRSECVNNTVITYELNTFNYFLRVNCKWHECNSIRVKVTLNTLCLSLGNNNYQIFILGSKLEWLKMVTDLIRWNVLCVLPKKYLNVLENWLMSQIDKGLGRILIFQLDSIWPHHQNTVAGFIHTKALLGQWIDHGGMTSLMI